MGKKTIPATGANPNKARSSEQARAARAKSGGRPKGSTNKVTVVAQLQALHKAMGMPFEEAVALTAKKLYNDFLVDKNVSEWNALLRHLSNKLTQEIPKEILIENPYMELTQEQLEQKIALLQNKLNGE